MGIFKKSNTKDILINYNKLSDNLYINNNEKKIIINNNCLNFEEIIDVKLIENSLNKISGLGTGIGNNNIIFGQNKEMINQINIEIKTNNLNYPFFSIPFLKLGIHLGYDKTSKKYKEAYQKAQYCLSILEIIIKNNTQIYN